MVGVKREAKHTPRFAGPIFGVVRFHRARQAITIRSSGGLSDAEAGRPKRLAARVPLGVPLGVPRSEVEKMVQEAEQMREQDQRKKA